MSIIETRIRIGADEPFRILHITDTHLSHADMRDGEAKLEQAARRAPCFPLADKMLEDASRLSKELGIPILHTGDLIDFVSEANLDAVKEFVANNDCLTVAGNHEFSLFLGEEKEDAAHRERSLAKVTAAFGHNVRTYSRVIGGVNFVGLDNGYYLFDEGELEFLKGEVAKGLPIVLYFHNPLYTRELYDYQRSFAPTAYIVGTPEELMKDYTPYRYEQQLADGITKETVEYIKSTPSVKAIIAGHIHRNYEGYLTDSILQIATSVTDIRIIEFC